LILQILFIYNIAKEHPSINIWLPLLKPCVEKFLAKILSLNFGGIMAIENLKKNLNLPPLVFKI
jgi:hypothetical protein